MTWPSPDMRTSHSMPAPMSMAARKAAMLFSGTPGPWSPRCANPCCPGLSGSGLDLDDRIHLDRDTQREDRDADGRSSMAPYLAEHLLHQFGRAVGDLWLVGEITVAVDENAELDDPPDPVERAQRRLDLRKQHDAAAARGRLARFQVHILAQPAFDQAAVLGKADLPADVQQAIGLDRGNIGRNRRGGLGKGDAEFGKALFDAHGAGLWSCPCRPSTLAPMYREACPALADRHQLK